MTNMANTGIFVAVGLFVLLVRSVIDHLRTIRKHGRQELARHADVARVMSLDVSDKRRAWMLARVAKGDTFGAIMTEDWEPLP